MLVDCHESIHIKTQSKPRINQSVKKVPLKNNGQLSSFLPFNLQLVKNKRSLVSPKIHQKAGPEPQSTSPKKLQRRGTYSEITQLPFISLTLQRNISEVSNAIKNRKEAVKVRSIPKEMNTSLKIVMAPISMPSHTSYGSKFHYVRGRVSSTRNQLPDLSYINGSESDKSSQLEVQQAETRNRAPSHETVPLIPTRKEPFEFDLDEDQFVTNGVQENNIGTRKNDF
jgi:hypothetical protein